MPARERRAAHLSWANTENRIVRTQPARDAFAARFERQFEHVADPVERAQRAESARKAHYIAMGQASGAARRAKRGKP